LCGRVRVGRRRAFAFAGGRAHLEQESHLEGGKMVVRNPNGRSSWAAGTIGAISCAASSALCAASPEASSAPAAIAAASVSAAPSPLLAIDRNRTTVVERIVGQWGEALARTGAGLTSEQLRAVLSGLRADHLLAASLAGNLEGLRNVVAMALTSNAEVKASLLQDKALGDASDDLVYTPVTPCRLADTRGAGGQFGANSARDFKVWASGGFAAQGGSATNCGVPANPAAVAVNITAVTPAGAGNLIAYPTGTPSFTSVLNYQTGQNALANGAIVRTCVPNCANQLTIATNGAGADVVLDIAGYFRAPQGGYVASVTAGTGIAVGGTAANPTVGIADGGVGAVQLANNAVTQAKLSPPGAPAAGSVLGTDGTNLQWLAGGGGGGGVSAVTASAPLASSGGATPNISLSGAIPVANGGTGQTALAANGVVIGQGSGAVATAAGASGQVLVGTAGAPAFTSSPAIGGNLGVAGNASFGGNLGIGTNFPASRLHVVSSSSQIPPRLESSGTMSFGAGLDFYHGATGKGYVGVPDTGAFFGPGEMIVFGGTGTKTSLWARQTRIITMDTVDGTSGIVGVGIAPDPFARLYVESGSRNAAVLGSSLLGYGVVGSSTSFPGVRGSSTDHAGVQGESLQSHGVDGYSYNGAGVRGISTNNSGVYGETSVSSLIAAGVYGKGIVSGAIGVIGEANVANAVGVYGVSASAGGFGVYARNTAGRALYVEGNATQDFGYSGVVKAMVEMTVGCCVDGHGYFVLSKCFNGGINSSTGNCGLTITQPLNGVARIDFGYPITNRFLLGQREIRGDREQHE
jgi:hypothetical protein